MNTHREAASSSQLSADQNRTRPSRWRSLRSSSRRSATCASTCAALSSSTRKRRATQRIARSARPGPLHQPEHERRRDPHHDDPDDGDESVQRVDAPDRDRDDEPDPQDEVEHHRRADTDRAQREPGVGAADARQGEQPVAERRTGGAPAGHDARQGARAHLDAEHPHPREVLARCAERGAGEERVREQGGELEHETEDQQPRFDLLELGPRAPEPGDERHHEEVQDGDEGDQLQREPEAFARRLGVEALDLRQLARHQTRCG